MEDASLFFVREVEEYFAFFEKCPSARVKELLSTSRFDFREEDRRDYYRLIHPARETIKEALRQRLKRARGEKQIWVIDCLSCIQTVISLLVAEVLLEEENSQREISGLLAVPDFEVYSSLREGSNGRDESPPTQLSLDTESHREVTPRPVNTATSCSSCGPESPDDPSSQEAIPACLWEEGMETRL